MPSKTAKEDDGMDSFKELKRQKDAMEKRGSELLICAFVEGAKWWESKNTGEPMSPANQQLAEITAECRLAAGILGLDHDSRRTNKDMNQSAV